MRLRPPRTPNPVEVVTLAIDIHGAEKMAAKGPTRKVLLLEDRDDFREVLRDYLVTCSFQVVSVNSGIEGLREIMNNGGFDIILCDMLMPKMGGEMFYWAVTRVRPATRDRFIFFTGHKNNPAIEFFFKRVNARVLFKPFKLAALDSAIRDASRKLS
jgi:DNA-binding NtrC family response regulator